MPVAITCPNCRTSFRAPDQVVGKNVRCTKCQKPFLAKPTPSAPAVGAAAPAARAAVKPSRPPAKRSGLWVLGGVVCVALAAGAFLMLGGEEQKPTNAVVAKGPTSTEVRPTEIDPPATKQETKVVPVPKVEPKVEAKVEPQVEAKVEPKFEAKAEPRSEPRELRSLPTHSGGAWRVSWSPDGRRVLTTGSDRIVRVSEAETGRTVREIVGSAKGPVTCAAYSPDGKIIASASEDRTIRLWDADTGKEIRNFQGHSGRTWEMAFSLDGKRLVSGGRDRLVRLWDVATGQEIRNFTGHSAEVTGVAFAPDGKRVLSCSGDKTLRLWDTETGQVVRVFSGHTGGIHACTLSADGTIGFSAGGSDKTIGVWEVATGRMTQTLTDQTSQPGFAACTPNGRYVISADQDHIIRLWDVKTGQIVHALAGHTANLRGLAVSPKGNLAVSSDNTGVVKLWYLGFEPASPSQNAGDVLVQAKKLVPTAGKLVPEKAIALAEQPPRPDKTTRVVLETVFVGCQASRNEIIRILNRLPGGIYDLEFDAKAKQARFRTGFTEKAQLADLFSVVRDSLEPTGLFGWPMFPDLKEQPIGRLRFGENRTWRLDELVFEGVFAASAESQQALRDMFKDCRVTFYGEDRLKTVQLVGKALDYATVVKQLEAAGFHSKPTSMDGKIAVRLNRVYLQCEPSRQAARRALEKVPGLTDLVLNPAASTITCRVPRANYDRRFAGFQVIGEPRPAAKPVAPVAAKGPWTPDSALREVGLAGKEEYLEPPAFALFDTVMMRLEGPENKRVTLYRVFAGSPEARALIEKTLAPHKVTILGNGEQCNVQIDGQELDEDALQKQLIAVGLYGSIVDPDQKPLTAKDKPAGPPQLPVKFSLANGSGKMGMDFSPDGKTLAACSEGKVRLWDMESGKARSSFAAHQRDVRQVKFSPDGKTLASIGEGDKTVKLWDAATSQIRLTLQGHDDDPNSIAFAPTGATLASVDWYGGLIIWDAGTGKTLHKINSGTREVSALVYSPDGTRLYMGGTNDEPKETVIQVWDVATGKQVSVIAKPHAPHRQYGHRVRSLAISPDGKWLASSGNDRQIKIWDLETAKERCAIQEAGSFVKGLAFLEKGRHLAGTRDPLGLGGGSIIWDVASGKELYAFGDDELTYTLAVSPDERLIAVGGTADFIAVYDAAALKK